MKFSGDHIENRIKLIRIQGPTIMFEYYLNLEEVSMGHRNGNQKYRGTHELQSAASINP